MPLFAQHKPTGRHGWITGFEQPGPIRRDHVYKVMLRFWSYDDNYPWWDQPVKASLASDWDIVLLKDCRIISTEQAILLGLLIERQSSSEIA